MIQAIMVEDNEISITAVRDRSLLRRRTNLSWQTVIFLGRGQCFPCHHLRNFSDAGPGLWVRPKCGRAS